MFKKKFPKVVRIEPAASCNFQCTHCPTGTGAKVKGIMNKSIFELVKTNIHNNLSDIEVIVLYHGGEPLLNKIFFEMISYFVNLNKKLFIKTVTNGALLTADIAEKIVLSGLTQIEISLDGMSPEESESIRIGSTTAITIQNIKVLLQYIKKYNSNLKVSIATTQFIDSLADINFMNTKKYNWIKNYFENEILDNEVSLKSTYAYAWSDMQVDENIYEIIEDKNDMCSSYCDHIENTITIRSNGDIVPCCYDLTSQLVMGNIKDNSLENIWNNIKYLKLRESIHNKDYISICDNCSVVKPNKYLKRLI